MMAANNYIPSGFTYKLNSTDIALLLAYNADNKSDQEGFEDSVRLALQTLNVHEETLPATFGILIANAIIDNIEGHPNRYFDKLLNMEGTKTDAIVLHIYGMTTRELGKFLASAIMQTTEPEEFNASVDRIADMMDDVAAVLHGR